MNLSHRWTDVATSTSRSDKKILLLGRHIILSINITFGFEIAWRKQSFLVRYMCVSFEYDARVSILDSKHQRTSVFRRYYIMGYNCALLNIYVHILIERTIYFCIETTGTTHI